MHNFSQELYQIWHVEEIVPDAQARTPSFGVKQRSENMFNDLKIILYLNEKI